MFKDHYKLAFALSLTVHLVCVTAVEAAVFLGKVLDPSIRTPLITFRTIQSELLKATDRTVLPKIAERIPEENHVVISEERQQDQGVARKDTSKSFDKPAVSKQKPSSLGRTSGVSIGSSLKWTKGLRSSKIIWWFWRLKRTRLLRPN